MPKSSLPIQLRLKQAGYETYVFAGHKLSGFIRYFDHRKQNQEKRTPAAELGEQALKELKSIGPSPAKPVFVLVHFIDPHHPYDAPVSPDKFGSKQVDRYDAELSYVDSALRPILKLMNKKEYRDWLVLFTSDHGESFYEHGTANHGFTLYDEEVRVPLIIRAPDAAPKRISTATCHLDVLPTILDWSGETITPGLDGKSLLPLLSPQLRAADAPRRLVFSEFFRTGHVFGAYDGRYSLIYKKYQNTFELYDRETDPGQQNNIFHDIRKTALEPALKKHVRESLQRIDAASKKKK